ncbi:hypothetical protein GSbR_31520 [Geobacter sp. SVR]|nr:hypothetical protein GSVR_04050 [Geobacter sp. SVR]GCF86552.1 hypothetical protein GSbR_31520 [Geobacter sp. SVR]
MRKNLFVFLILISNSAAYGMVYSWTDTTGITHYANKAYEIPARYRARAKSLYPEQADFTTTPQTKSAAQPTSPQAKPEVPTPPQQPQPAAIVQKAKPDETVSIKPQVVAPQPQKNSFEREARREQRRQAREARRAAEGE